MGLLFALSIPGLVCLLVLLAAVERCGRWAGDRGLLPWRRRRRTTSGRAPLTAAGVDELHAFFSGSRRAELDDRKSQSLLREEEGDNAPPRSRIDLDRGVADLVLPPRDRSP
ncbi:DUF6191 domain-containing protein [Amycolatopsis magusensis]|uniref:DUF6191 domain-containing protein n=1 Tax=Amycolatopsis magusensis TaxID=882444 RepID=UPI0024A8D4C0|nr:DUF6191 domain-containing protein [Amycolatopsis magusensis]MDI5980311.1 DUF6191 domain-containing protein [Amycolatopsis magusensis]